MILLLIVTFIILGIFDLNTTLKKRDSKTLILYFSLLMLGFVINMLLALDKVPASPAVIIEKIVKLVI